MSRHSNKEIERLKHIAAKMEVVNVKMRACQDVPNFLKKFDAVQKRTARSKLQLSAAVGLAALSLCGCAMISGQQGDLKITSIRFFWASEGVEFGTTNQNFNASLKVSKSGTDDQAVAAAVAAAVTAAINAAK